MKTTLFAKLALVAATGFCVSASALTDSTTFQVKIVITESCTISTTGVTDVNFGSNVRSATVSAATGTLNVNCSTGTPYSVALNGGTFPDGSGVRRMTKGSDSIAYNLYKSAGTTLPWTAATPLAGTGNGSNQALSVYGSLVTGASNAPAGSYADTVTATITY